MTPHIRSFKTFVAANMLFLLQGRTSSHHLTYAKASADDKHRLDYAERSR
ncbi:MAG: hypothetical protein KIG47_08950 [Prevotellamassilia sp.]|nr:hypothetical protein [Prevotellamassilia sp.]